MERNASGTNGRVEESPEDQAGMRLLPCPQDQVRRGGVLQELSGD